MPPDSVFFMLTHSQITKDYSLVKLSPIIIFSYMKITLNVVLL